MKNAYSKYLLRAGSQNILDDKIRLNREKKDSMHLFHLYFLKEIKILMNGFMITIVKTPYIHS